MNSDYIHSLAATVSSFFNCQLTNILPNVSRTNVPLGNRQNWFKVIIKTEIVVRQCKGAQEYCRSS